MSSGSITSTDDGSPTTSLPGGYFLSGVLSLSTSVIVTKTGYEPVEITGLNLAVGEATEFNIALVPLAGLDTTAPTTGATPGPGTYEAAVSVTLTCGDDGGTGCKETLDGSEPTAGSVAFSAPIPVSATTTIKYFAKDDAGNASGVVTALYTINKPASSGGGGGGGGGGCFVQALASESGLVPVLVPALFAAVAVSFATRRRRR